MYSIDNPQNIFLLYYPKKMFLSSR